MFRRVWRPPDLCALQGVEIREYNFIKDRVDQFVSKNRTSHSFFGQPTLHHLLLPHSHCSVWSAHQSKADRIAHRVGFSPSFYVAPSAYKLYIMGEYLYTLYTWIVWPDTHMHCIYVDAEMNDVNDTHTSVRSGWRTIAREKSIFHYIARGIRVR